MMTPTETSLKKSFGFSFMELLMVLAVLLVMAAVILPRIARSHTRAAKINCVNNLKQVGLSFRIWALDNGDRFPMAVPLNDGGTNFGTMDFTNGASTYMHFLVMSNELSTPKILWCPNETDSNRNVANDFNTSPHGPPPGGSVIFKSNTNLSYFVGLVGSENPPNQILAGDRNLTNGAGLKDGVMDLRPGQPIGWQNSLHLTYGNFTLSDGSVQQFSSTRFLNYVADNTLTNRLSMPILGGNDGSSSAK